MMERLTKRQADGSVIAWHPLKYYNYGDFNKVLDRLAYYEDMEEQGRLHITPCKVGDKVYSKDGKVAEIEDFYIDKHGISATVSFVCDYDCKDCAFNSWHTEYSGENSCDGEYGTAMVSVDDFGKTVFLTRELAEKALKEGADHDPN